MPDASMSRESTQDREEEHESYQPAEHDEEPKPLGQEADEVIEDASEIGTKRLQRSYLGSAITALIGGMSVSFGAVSMVWASASVEGSIAAPSPAHLLGALAFPTGFIILLQE